MGGFHVRRFLQVRRRTIGLLGVAAALGARAGTVLAHRAEESDPDIRQPSPATPDAFMRRAFDMRRRAVELGDQGYGAVVVRRGVVVGQSWSRVVLDRDPTQHAEMAAIRDAARRLRSRNLEGCHLYSSSRACPMCEAAAYWASIDAMFFGERIEQAGRPRLCR